MKIQIRSYSHAVGEFNYHIQITPAYRRKVMDDDTVDKLVKAYITAKLEELKIRIVTMRGGREHLHIFVADCKNIAPSELVRQLKGFSSFMMRKNHWNLFRHLLWGDKFCGAKVIFAEALEARRQKQSNITSSIARINIGLTTRFIRRNSSSDAPWL